MRNTQDLALRKYKKSKERLRVVMAEMASEQSKNQQLSQVNFLVNEKV